MNITVLVVDDSATVRQQVATALSQAGFQVVEASDGSQGLNRAKQGGIDCVISDVNMPIMNGIEMVTLIKQDPILSSTPVVMLTTEGSKELIAKAKQAGASGWIVKPFKAEMLVAAVRKLTSVPV
jgi:two-component system, chemotaxis family, chemotaxis protein CheY